MKRDKNGLTQQQRWYQGHKEYYQEYNKNYHLKHYQKRIRKPINKEARKKEWAEKSKENLRKKRVLVLNYYGGNPPKCNCCGESIIQFLSIDHINGGGNKHRKTITKEGKGGNMYLWLIRNNFPEGFQVLCHNCNMAKGFYGKCPHNML